MTLKLAGDLTYEVTRSMSDGTIVEKRTYTQNNSQEPRLFVLCAPLLDGANGAGRAQRGHNASEVRTGDVVQIRTLHLFGVYYCNEITIHRRPGGKVPTTTQDRWLIELGRKTGSNFDHNRWDIKANKEQAREEAITKNLVDFILKMLPASRLARGRHL